MALSPPSLLTTVSLQAVLESAVMAAARLDPSPLRAQAGCARVVASTAGVCGALHVWPVLDFTTTGPEGAQRRLWDTSEAGPLQPQQPPRQPSLTQATVHLAHAFRTNDGMPVRQRAASSTRRCTAMTLFVGAVCAIACWGAWPSCSTQVDLHVLVEPSAVHVRRAGSPPSVPRTTLLPTWHVDLLRDHARTATHFHALQCVPLLSSAQPVASQSCASTRCVLGTLVTRAGRRWPSSGRPGRAAGPCRLASRRPRGRAWWCWTWARASAC